MTALSITSTRLGQGSVKLSGKRPRLPSLLPKLDTPGIDLNVYGGMDSLIEWKLFSSITGYGEKLRATLQTLYGNRGAGLFSCHRNNAFPNTDEVNVGVNWLSPGRNSPDDKGVFSDDAKVHTGSTGTTAADLLTVDEPQTPFTSYDIWYVDTTGTAGTWAYRPDGGSWVNGPTPTGDGLVKRLHVVGTFTTSLDVRPCNAAGTTATKTVIIGFSFQNTGDGVLFHNFAHSGASMEDLCRVTMGNPFLWLTQAETPDLLIIDSGNDAFTGGDPALFATRLVKFIGKFPSDCAVILVSPPPFDPVANPTRPYTVQAAFRDQYFKVAASTGAEFIDIYAAWGEDYSTAVSMGFQGDFADGLHPNDAGHQDIHDRILTVLGLL